MVPGIFPISWHLLKVCRNRTGYSTRWSQLMIKYVGRYMINSGAFFGLETSILIEYWRTFLYWHAVESYSVVDCNSQRTVRSV